ncbi:MAG: efflux RND transporter periplasmic adaptor subunit [Bacteroidales bacterium]|jgi:RND family efflux transporter MFP subunit
MKTLTQAIIFVALVVFAVACGSSVDKKAELAKLKKQHDELAVKIKKLESELQIGDSATKTKVTSVSVTEAKAQEFNHYLEVQGKVDGEDNIAVSAQMAGAITAVFVKEGDAVRKGQTLAQIDNSVMQQQIASTKQQLEFATNLYNKQKALWDKQIGSEVQYLTAKNNKENLEKALATLNDQLEMTRIKSPINGSVEEVNLKVGQMASPGLPAVRVVNFSTVKVVAEIAEAYAPKIKPGNKVIVFFPDFNTEVNSTIRFTSKYINPVNRTFVSEVRLGPSNVQYRANMMAVVRINDYHNPSAFTIPVTLVRETSEGKYIYVAKQENGKLVARRLPVTVGSTYNGLAEITAGITAGDKIITTGFNSLIDGELIQAN